VFWPNAMKKAFVAALCLFSGINIMMAFLKMCNAKNKRYDEPELHFPTIFFAHNNVLSRDVFFQNNGAG